MITKRPNSSRPSRPLRTSRSAPARRGAAQVTDIQRARMLSSAAMVVSEHGYGQMSVARITARAGVSRRTFYEVFADREDCFLALFEDALARLAERMVPAYEGGRVWREQVRAGLGALLAFLDEQPQLGSLLIVDGLSAGPRVLERRAEILAGLGAVLDRDGAAVKSMRGRAQITGEGVVGAVFSVIHTRLLARRPRALVELLNPLVSTVVLPYLGVAAARRELERPAPELAPRTRGSRNGASSSPPARVTEDPLAGLPMRLTYRTLRVLGAIGETPGASNHLVAQHAGVLDQGQMSKLLARLERLGLIHNETARAAAQPNGKPNAWRLTVRGRRVQSALSVSAPSCAHGIGGEVAS